MAFAFGFWDKTYREIRLGRGLGGKEVVKNGE